MNNFQEPAGRTQAEDPINMEVAAAYLEIPKATLYRFTSDRRIPFYKVGKRIYFKKADLENYIFNQDTFRPAKKQIKNKMGLEVV
jgi:excisionase family DNA binding protein